MNADKTKRKIPFFMRRHAACPDCGLVLKDNGKIQDTTVTFEGREIPAFNYKTKAFDCPRCKTHYTWQDFWESNEDKWDRTMAHDSD